MIREQAKVTYPVKARGQDMKVFISGRREGFKSEVIQ
jgi:hypothetical protein